MDQSDDQIIRIGNYTSQFRGKDSLGSGGYGLVYNGHQIANPKNKVAVKLINLKKSSYAQVMNEIQCMLNNRSKGTLEILATQKIKFGAQNQDHYAIVTEKMDGSLRKLLQQKGKLNQIQAIEWAFKIIECYKYLHKAKVIHRDLKPQNVLYRKIGDQIQFKIGDFGNSRHSKASRSLTIGKGSFYYISPQQARQGKYTDKTDVYAFGCMLFQFLFGSEKVPIEVSNACLENGQINKKQVRKLLGSMGISKNMIQLIEGCLMYEQVNRLAWKDIFAHPIFQKNQKKDINTKVESKGRINFVDNEESTKSLMLTKVGKNFKIIKKLAKGAHSQIYYGINTVTNLEVAVKIEQVNSNPCYLLFECKLYNYLHNDQIIIDKYLPSMYYVATEGQYNVFVMDLMGPSIESLFFQSNKKFSLKTVLMLFDQMITIIQYIHNRQFIHSDIKIDNFCVGRNQNAGKIFMVGLSLAKRYIKKDGKHIQYREGINMGRNLLYASINSHLGIQQSCRDDMESIGYVIMHLLRGELPWSGLKAKNDKEKQQKIKQKKLLTSVQNLCKGYPAEFSKYFVQVRNLKFVDRPNYSQIKGMFNGLFRKSGFEYDYLYDWVVKK